MCGLICVSFDRPWNHLPTPSLNGRYGGTKLERARDMFEHALSQAPPEHAKPIFLQYALLEEQVGGCRDLYPYV